MAPSPPPPTVVSCPGKVLIAGGYLVLDPAYTGFAVSTPSRFYTVVQALPAKEGEGDKDTNDSFDITVVSPQFTDGRWEYTATKEGDEWKVGVKGGTAPNPFVYLAISSSLSISAALVSHLPTHSLHITIVGSNDFYSQSRDDSSAPPPFAVLNTTLSAVHKTGLGSSAAMTSSLCSALLIHFNPTPIDKPTLQLAHNLSQYVHSLAQGKVGSGFDVSCAVYGSQVYRRFAPAILEALLAKPASEITSKGLLDALSPYFNTAWTAPHSAALVSPFSLPPGVVLLLADVDAGSSTPSMVSRVLKWRAAQPEQATDLWNALKESNSELAESFATLIRLHNDDPKVFESTTQELASLPASSWKETNTVASAFLAAKLHILQTRTHMRKMGEYSGVPIEPPEQTKLLDAVSALNGVVGAGVPGAGGYDAIWVLVLSTVDPAQEVVPLLEGWQEMSVRPLSRHAWVVGGTEEGERGLKMESVEDVEGLSRVLSA